MKHKAETSGYLEVILGPMFWLFDVPQTFAQKCILREYDIAGVSYLNMNSPEYISIDFFELILHCPS